MSHLQGKHIVLGITGSIAAYKACLIARLLVRAGAEVQVVITPAGKEFITPLTLSTLTRHPVVSEFFDRRDGSWHSHVDLGLWADAMLIAPATAATLAKMAIGVADNMLLTTYLSMKAPVFVAPAMDLDMYAHPATRRNLATIKDYGNHIIEPTSGQLASHLEGKGRMQEPEVIVGELEAFFARRAAGGALQGRTVLITAGPTYERIDPVRFIGNYSSGKMGYALARECALRGARVELVSGPVALQARDAAIHVTPVESAAQMLAAATQLFPTCQAAILCAAVADYTPAAPAGQKLKRTGNELTLHLRPTADIAATLGAMKHPGQVVAGFALETNDARAHARAKMQAKHLDFIVLNSLEDKGAGFRCDTNKVTILTPEGERDFPLKPKTEVAADIIDQLCASLPV